MKIRNKKWGYKMQQNIRKQLVSGVLRTMLPVAAAGLFMASGAQAAVTYSGSISNFGEYIGYTSDGSLTVNNGSTLSFIGNLFLGYNVGTNGTVNIDGAGSTLTLVQNLFDGWYGNGSLNITNGGAFQAGGGPSGTTENYLSATTGNIKVDGKGSSFSLGYGEFELGTYGSSIMMITNGASASGSLQWTVGTNWGNYPSQITVNGQGSNLALNGDLVLGRYGTGILAIGNGGAVSVNTLEVNNANSHLYMDVGTGSSLNVNGALTNTTGITFTAGAGAASGIYKPITAGGWAGNGTIQALGGVLNADHTVTVNSAITTTAGTAASMDLYTNQRGIVTDPSTGKSVGIGFQATATSNPITFSAKAIGGSELTSLQSLIGTGNSVLSAWSFTTTGTTVSSTNPVYLSLTAGAGQSLYSLSVYDYNGTSWSQLTPADLAYDGNYASFTAFNLNDVAVVGDTTPTPIPAAVWLLGSGLFGLAGLKRRKMMA
jgi:T5SS/PEP-CTERM-associated repeat protein